MLSTDVSYIPTDILLDKIKFLLSLFPVDDCSFHNSLQIFVDSFDKLAGFTIRHLVETVND